MTAEQLYLELQKKIAKARAIPPCQTTDPELWFGIPEYGKGFEQINYAVAKQLCNQCPVREACLAYALKANETHGVWGGLSPNERRDMLRAHGRLTAKRGRSVKA